MKSRKQNHLHKWLKMIVMRKKTQYSKVQNTCTLRPKNLKHWFLYDKCYWKGEQLIFNFKSKYENWVISPCKYCNKNEKPLQVCLSHFFKNWHEHQKLIFFQPNMYILYSKLWWSLPVSPDISQIYCLLFSFFSLNGEQAVQKIIYFRKIVLSIFHPHA